VNGCFLGSDLSGASEAPDAAAVEQFIDAAHRDVSALAFANNNRPWLRLLSVSIPDSKRLPQDGPRAKLLTRRNAFIFGEQMFHSG
jgi:hypothetical protein